MDGLLEVTEEVGGGGGETFSVHDFFLKPSCLQDFVFLRHNPCTKFFPHISSFITNLRFPYKIHIII